MDSSKEEGDVIRIPPITEPMGRYWSGPKAKDIQIDDTHALMTKRSFNKLLDYSISIPTGVYIGKMWKAYRKGVWYLIWFGESEYPDKCSQNVREILTV